MRILSVLWIFIVKTRLLTPRIINNHQPTTNNQLLTTKKMENTNILDLVTAGLALSILIGGFLMMFTNVFTTKR
ncbi:hypothetical protein IQ247_03065 [Plectonema cf. radiosum LEGE 06105]|uniref:Uncharacterized protein n=1 Tax=Plectonema cf. radiosum LEGE 06105 TaxID=945769 RepID=A0A8J7JT48_9CYAN|nr:hypothetical protein [Plectonema radiosum]MBE9211705.1 hypothetical protein [Plectonema cf. radiosum LEGE 06105]